MNNKLLYFPYINIPESGWTIKSILYWDKVGIIVPQNFVERPNRFNQFTLDLLRTDLIEQVFPYEYIYRVRKFDDAFIQMIDQEKFNLAKRQEHFSRGRFSRIHIQKFGEPLFNHLIKMGIAQRQDWEWYYVENKTARLLMIYLATVIGKTGNFTPATDDPENLNTSISQNTSQIILNRIRQSIIDELLPYPIEPDLIKLSKFKEKHNEELKSFRILIEQATLQLSYLKNKRREEMFDIKMAEIDEKREKIYRDLNQSKIGQITWGTICAITGAIIAFNTENNPLSFFSFANAVYTAFQGYDSGTILSRDYSYLALIDKKLKPVSLP